MKLLALDFDGVISDSAPEAYTVARRTYAQMTQPRRLAEAPDEEIYARFLEMMPLGNRAEDFGIELRILDEGAEVADQAAYDAYRASLDPDWLREFHKRFYRTRSEWAESDPEGWRARMGPYPALVEALRARSQPETLAIATAKDARSVRVLLREYGIDDLFDPDLVLDKETGVSKTAHLEHLKRRTGVAYAEMTFVDDKVNHLDTVAPLGVPCVLAAWGYNGERERRLALANGHRVCDLAEFARLLSQP